MPLLAIKLLAVPVMMSAITIVERRWGSGISGWLTGLPLTSGPISLILALQHGQAFATLAAAGSLGGIASVGLYALTYSLVATRAGWKTSLLAGILVFFASAFFWNEFPLALIPSFFVAIFVLALAHHFIPRRQVKAAAIARSAWDIPARIAAAMAVLLLITGFSSFLGPQLSGLLSPFPVFSSVLVVFTHRQLGADHGIQFLRGVVTGTFAYAGFFLVIGLLLPSLGILWTYLLATLVALLANGASLRLVR
jgi:hypothetical protein